MEIVKIVQNQAFADSRIIAEHFGKAHRDVLRAIETLLQNLNEADAQNCAALFKRKEWMKNPSSFTRWSIKESKGLKRLPQHIPWYSLSRLLKKRFQR